MRSLKEGKHLLVSLKPRRFIFFSFLSLGFVVGSRLLQVITSKLLERFEPLGFGIRHLRADFLAKLQCELATCNSNVIVTHRSFRVASKAGYRPPLGLCILTKPEECNAKI